MSWAKYNGITSGSWRFLFCGRNKDVSSDIKTDPYIELAAAILRQAVDDYIKAILTQHTRKIKEIETFLLSDWGQLLSFDQGEYIIKEARRIAESVPNKKFQRRDSMKQKQ